MAWEMVGPRREVDASIRLDLEFSTLGLAWKLPVFEQLDLEIQAVTNGLEVRTAHVFLESHKSSWFLGDLRKGSCVGWIEIEFSSTMILIKIESKQGNQCFLYTWVCHYNIIPTTHRERAWRIYTVGFSFSFSPFLFPLENVASWIGGTHVF